MARVSSYDPDMPLTYSLKWVKGNASRTYREDWTEVCGFVISGETAWTAARHVELGWVMLEMTSDGSLVKGKAVGSRLEADALLVGKQP